MELLSQTATDRGVAGYDRYFGYGILNLAGRVEALTGEELTTEGILWAVDIGLLAVVGNAKLSPGTNASRAQAVTTLMRVHGT